MMEDKFLIPIDDAIKDFKHHLDSHDRTILSARFGDGKSFFLSHFMEDADVAEHYTFLSIFPVNYQVVENHDIFDLIERDILLQMLMKGIIEPNVEISDAEALAIYLQCQPLSFLDSFLPLLSILAHDEKIVSTAAFAVAIKKFLKNAKQKIDKMKLQSDDNQIDQFFNAVEKNPIVGQDAISGLIQKGLEQYRTENPDKRVVLVVEDLDRIDPAHLFRILNVFSAHVDYCYRMGLKPDESIAGNKFGLDKVIFVLDYNNLKCLYNHFYGTNTSFDGYIEKFTSSNYFSYSLNEEKFKYLLEFVARETGLNQEILSNLITQSDLNNKSLRNVVNSIINTSNFVINQYSVKTQYGETVSLHTGILRLIAILRKLGVDESEILTRLKNAVLNKKSSTNSLFMYLAPYLNIAKFKNPIGTIRFACSMDMVNTVSVDNIVGNGTAFCSFVISMNEDKAAEIQLLSLLKKIMKMVAK